MTSQAIAQDIVLKLLGGWQYPPAWVSEEYTNHTGRIHLDGRPVVQVHRVNKVDGVDAGAAVDYIVQGSSVILSETPIGSVGPCRLPSGRVLVEYEYGYTSLPDAVQWAIDELKGEIDNAMAGAPCALPERVTSVSRQGLSWTLIDPMDFLDKGRTGMPRVDFVLAVYNPTAQRRRSRVWSPEYPPGRGRLLVTVNPP